MDHVSVYGNTFLAVLKLLLYDDNLAECEPWRLTTNYLAVSNVVS